MRKLFELTSRNTGGHIKKGLENPAPWRNHYNLKSN